MGSNMSDFQVRILVIHGPNLNLLQNRNTKHYGNYSLEELNKLIASEADRISLFTEIIQSNSESEIVERIQTADEHFDGIVINPAGFGYSSVAILDALALCKCPIVEVHLSNIHSRVKFRNHTLISRVARGQISGFKEFSYILGLHAVRNEILKQRANETPI